MKANQATTTTLAAPARMHPLMAGAAASVMLVCLLGAAAITGILPSSQGNAAPAAVAQQAAALPLAAAAPVQNTDKPRVKEVVRHRTVVHHQVAQQAAPAAPRPVQVAQAPQPQYSPVGIATGAVVGGLLGNQVGSGNGRTIATIAGAVGGGYIGNRVANQQ